MAHSDHVHHVIKAQDMTGLAARFNDIMEQKYASNIREPLAKAYQRNYQWPEHLAENKENYPFGNATISSDSTKELISPENPLFNPPEV
jgi:hypothetical protein